MEAMTIQTLQASMAEGELSAQGLTKDYLARIDELDRQSPGLHAILTLNPDALVIAAGLDVERQTHGPRGPLHGIPLLVKDNICTGDRMATTAGSLALDGVRAARDAYIVARLRAAGAVILGKANLSEWANFRSTRSSSGWSSLGGQTRNPYALDRTPCGSSSGSAVAVAANLCAAAIGTETDGSIVCPASMNSLVGFKPTVGRISRAGIVPIAHSQDTAGPMTRSVADAAVLLTALAATDPEDSATRNAPPASDYTQFLDPQGLRGARIGVARNFFGVDGRVDAIMEAALQIMQQLGATIVDPANLETAPQLSEPELELLLYEFKHGLNQFLPIWLTDAPVQSLADLLTFNAEHHAAVMPYFGQELFEMAQAKGALSEVGYLQAKALCRRLSRAEGIDATLREHKLDAIVAPTNAPAWLIDLVNGDQYRGGSSGPAAVAGYPSITVPAGYVMGLPIGLSFIGGAYQEATLIRLAYAFEQATRARRAPQFLSTAALD